MDDTQLSKLRGKLADLVSLKDVLGREAFEAAKANLERQIQVLLDTGGGVAVGGAVHVHNGDFVGRDKWQIILGNQYNHISTDEAPQELLLQAYYRALAGECRHLPLGVFDPKFVQPGWEEKLALHQVYVDLDVVSPLQGEAEAAKSWGLRLARGEGSERMPLLDTLAQPERCREVLLGDPGSGKTTFVNYLTYLLAEHVSGEEGVIDLIPEALQGLYPVRLILRDVAAHLPVAAACGNAAMLWDALCADLRIRLGDAAAERLWPYLQKSLLEKGALFLLDGLDEVPQAGRRRRCLLEAIQGLVATLPAASRILLTARPYAYADPAWRLSDFHVLALAPFNEAQVSHFVDQWYQVVRPAMGWDAPTAEKRGNRLAAALKARAYLADLSSRPLLLTLMTALHTSGGQLPEDRADLYEESVKLLLSRWQRRREVQDADGNPLVEPGIARALGVGDTCIRAALEQLAFDSHVRQGGERDREDAPADIPVKEVLAGFAPLLPEDVNSAVLLTYLETRAGLLLGRREGVYAFPHRSFQEYLAACHLANTDPEFAERLRLLVWEDPSWWREVFLLGVGKKRQGGLGDAVNVITTLVPTGPAEIAQVEAIHWRAAVIAAHALLELKLLDQASGRPHFEATLDRVRRWLVALVEGGHLPVKERWGAGDLLGKLRDPRPGVGVLPGTQDLPDILWVEVPEGPFMMGSLKDDAEAYDAEQPRHTVTLPKFYIGRYPITNAQYRPFVEGDGYANCDYWTAEGWAWRNGAEPDLSPLDDWPDEDFKRRYAKWLANRTPEKRSAPYWWDDPEWGLPNRPVVGICWYEAVAYTRWLAQRVQAAGGLHVWREGGLEEIPLSAQTFEVCLPSEAEWEKAARGTEGRTWAWGDTWETECANTEKSGLEQTSAVGLFPGGSSPYGALDMTGNVWEWTRSLWGRCSVRTPEYRYPYVADDGRESLEGPVVPVLRGGSWISSERFARCAYRIRNFPEYFDGSDGFRVVVSLGDSDF